MCTPKILKEISHIKGRNKVSGLEPNKLFLGNQHGTEVTARD